jgi:hypothetical protein
MEDNYRNITCKYIKGIIGIMPNSIIVGKIPTGNKITIINEDGTATLIDETQEGIEIEFEGELNTDQLVKLDATFSQFKRKRGT